MAVTVTKNVDIYLNALDRTILYNGIRKQISDSYWDTNITPLLYPLWDSAKDKLEVFMVKKDGAYLVQRNKYKRDFKTDTSSWSSYEFDPAGLPDYDVDDLAKKIKEKFVEFRDVEENRYEKAIETEYARTNALTWKKIAVVRKFMLQDSDYTMMEDSPVSAADKLLWKKYRAYIRDIPTIQNAETPFDVVFPITPDEYNARKSLNIDSLITEVVGDQGINAEYLSSSYHFWKMNSNTLSSFAQRMSFYIAARTSTVESVTADDKGGESGMRVMVSPIHTKAAVPFDSDGNKVAEDARSMAEKWKADDDKVNRDYITALLDAIEKGEL